MSSKNFVNQFKNTRRQAGLASRRPLAGQAGLVSRRPLGGQAGLEPRKPGKGLFRRLKKLLPGEGGHDKNPKPRGK